MQIRTFQQRIAFARRNLDIQRGSLRLAEARLRDGKGTALDVKQARSNLATNGVLDPTTRARFAQANNRLCILLGQSPQNLTSPETRPGVDPPTPPGWPWVFPRSCYSAVPTPRRRCERRRRKCAQVGVAQADLYPQSA